MRTVSVHWVVRVRGDQATICERPRAETQELDSHRRAFDLVLIHPGRYDAVVSTANFNLGSASWLPQAVLTTAEYRPGRHSNVFRVARRSGVRGGSA